MRNPEKDIKVGSELLDGELVGKHPDDVTKEEFESLGHIKKNLTRIIREKCMDCCGQQQNEVRWCMARTCELWPYRMGGNPFSERGKNMTEEQKSEMVERLKRAKEKK